MESSLYLLTINTDKEMTKTNYYVQYIVIWFLSDNRSPLLASAESTATSDNASAESSDTFDESSAISDNASAESSGKLLYLCFCNKL